MTLITTPFPPIFQPMIIPAMTHKVFEMGFFHILSLLLVTYELHQYVTLIISLPPPLFFPFPIPPSLC